jgi:hypothetical protein
VRVGVILGALLDLLGVVWLLQGLNILGGSPMTGDPFWAVAGTVLMVAGSMIVVLSVVRRARGSGPRG